MSSTFDSTYTDGPLVGLISQFGESISYTPSGESAETITAIVHRQSYSQEPADDGRGVLRRCIVEIQAADVTPSETGDLVTFDGLTWAVMEVEGPKGGLYDVTVQRYVPSMIQGEDHLIERM